MQKVSLPRHTALNRSAGHDDSNRTMSLKHHNAKRNGTDPDPGSSPGNPSAITPSQLAHELNNLLDGSLRSVGTVMRQLNTLGIDPQTTDQLAQKLRAADRSMHHMADVIERYANTPPGIAPAPGMSDSDSGSETNPNDPSGQTAEVFRRRGSLLDALTHAVNVYGPAIEQHGIELVTRLDPAASDLPAGPIYTVLANALNNAMQAIGRCDPSTPGSIPGIAPAHRITVRMSCDDQVTVEVLDTGAGLDPVLFDPQGGFRFGVTTRVAGHGIGLGVCRQIAHDLQGQLELAPNLEADHGTRLTLRYPRSAAPQSQSPPHETEARLAG